MLGQAAANLGDLEEALEHWRQAMAIDDGYVDPMLSAAEVLIHPMHDYDGATGLTRFAMPGYAAYAAMKGGVEVLTQYLAKELGAEGIAVNVRLDCV